MSFCRLPVLAMDKRQPNHLSDFVCSKTSNSNPGVVNVEGSCPCVVETSDRADACDGEVSEIGHIYAHDSECGMLDEGPQHDAMRMATKLSSGSLGIPSANLQTQGAQVMHFCKR